MVALWLLLVVEEKPITKAGGVTSTRLQPQLYRKVKEGTERMIISYRCWSGGRDITNGYGTVR